jgi:hypothetical protein
MWMLQTAWGIPFHQEKQNFASSAIKSLPLYAGVKITMT